MTNDQIDEVQCLFFIVAYVRFLSGRPEAQVVSVLKKEENEVKVVM